MVQQGRELLRSALQPPWQGWQGQAACSTTRPWDKRCHFAAGTVPLSDLQDHTAHRPGQAQALETSQMLQLQVSGEEF